MKNAGGRKLKERKFALLNIMVVIHYCGYGENLNKANFQESLSFYLIALTKRGEMRNRENRSTAKCAV